MASRVNAITILESNSVDLAYASSDQNSSASASFRNEINWIGEATPRNCLKQSKVSIVSRPSGSYGLNSLQSSILHSDKENSLDESDRTNQTDDRLGSVFLDINNVQRPRL